MSKRKVSVEDEQYTDDKLSREDFLLKRRSTMKKQPDWRKG